MILQFDFPLVKIQHINIWSKNAAISYHNFQISNTFLNNEKDEFDKPITLNWKSEIQCNSQHLNQKLSESRSQIKKLRSKPYLIDRNKREEKKEKQKSPRRVQREVEFDLTETLIREAWRFLWSPWSAATRSPAPSTASRRWWQRLRFDERSENGSPGKPFRSSGSPNPRI